MCLNSAVRKSVMTFCPMTFVCRIVYCCAHQRNAYSASIDAIRPSSSGTLPCPFFGSIARSIARLIRNGIASLVIMPNTVMTNTTRTTAERYGFR